MNGMTKSGNHFSCRRRKRAPRAAGCCPPGEGENCGDRGENSAGDSTDAESADSSAQIPARGFGGERRTARLQSTTRPLSPRPAHSSNPCPRPNPGPHPNPNPNPNPNP